MSEPPEKQLMKEMVPLAEKYGCPILLYYVHDINMKKGDIAIVINVGK